MYLYVDAVDNTLEGICALAELCDFFVVQRNVYLATDTVVTNYTKGAETYVVNTVFTVHKGGNGHSRIKSAEQALNNVTNDGNAG